MPAAVRCTGTVRETYFRGRHRISTALLPVAPNCTFSTHFLFRHVRGHGATRLRIRLHFRGNGYIAPSSQTNNVTIR